MVLKYKKKIENILPLLTFVSKKDQGSLAGWMLSDNYKAWDYDFLIENLSKFKNRNGNHRAQLTTWYNLNYGEWKAAKDKKEDTDVLNKLGDTLKDHFADTGKKVDEEWRERAIRERAHLLKRRATMAKDYAEKPYRVKLKLYPKLIDLSNQIRNITNRLETL